MTKTNETNTNKNPPSNTTQPNKTYRTSLGETVKRAPALIIVSKVTPALSTSSAACSQWSGTALCREALSFTNQDWIPLFQGFTSFCHSERFLRKLRKALFVTVGFLFCPCMHIEVSKDGATTCGSKMSRSLLGPMSVTFLLIMSVTATEAWQFWNAHQHGFTHQYESFQLRLLDPLFQQIRRERKSLIPLQYRNRGINEIRARRTKRRKQGCRDIWVAMVAELCYIFFDPTFRPSSRLCQSLCLVTWSL